AGSPLGVTTESAARLLNLLCLGFAGVATMALVMRLGGSRALGGAIALLFLLSLQTLVAFEGVASEPLYLALQSGALLVATTFRRGITPSRVAAFVVLA